MLCLTPLFWMSGVSTKKKKFFGQWADANNQTRLLLLDNIEMLYRLRWMNLNFMIITGGEIAQELKSSSNSPCLSEESGPRINDGLKESSCKKDKKNTPVQNQISTWKMKSVFSLFSFLICHPQAHRRTTASGSIQWNYWSSATRGGEDTVSSQFGTKCTSFHVTLQTVAVRYAGNKDIAYKYGECYPYEGASMAMWCKSASCYSAHSFPPLQTFSRWECNRI